MPASKVFDVLKVDKFYIIYTRYSLH